MQTVSPLRACLASVIVAAAFAHAALVFLYNSPSNVLKDNAAPVFRLYSGPELRQGWVLFAPDVASNNLHVLARARTNGGSVTRWYDISLFYLDEMYRNRFTATRSLSEGLAHAAPSANSNTYWRRATARAIILQTSAMVLNLYLPDKSLNAMQMEVDRRDVPLFGSTSKGGTVSEMTWGWVPMPSVQPVTP